MNHEGTGNVKGQVLALIYDKILQVCAGLCQFVFSVTLSGDTPHISDGEIKAEQE